ncbi:MAG: ComEC/Rec2 family competence protein [Acidobacteriota bacterium]
MPEPDNVHMRATTLLPESFAAYPLAQMATAFALGIIGARYFVILLSILIPVAGLATLAVGITFLAAGRRRFRVATILALLAMLLIGATLGLIEKTRTPANQLRNLIDRGVIAVGEPVEITGVLERDPEPAPERLYLQLRLESVRSRTVGQEASGIVLVLTSVQSSSSKHEFDQLDLRYGGRIRVMTLLERADNFRNPGVSSFTEYLDRKGYDATAFVKSPLLVERLENERIFLPLAWLYEWRRKLQAQIDARFSSDTAGVLDAALLGNRYNLSPSASERFREGGTFHVLVISGLHITFLGSLVFLIARRFTRNAALQFLLSVSVLWAYSLAVGAESSVVRAALMFTIVLFAPLVSRRASSLNSLGATALVLLAWRPSDLFDPSFQLTFVSVLAIVVFAWPLLEKLSAIGLWHPTRETPYPPSCRSWLRSFCETLFWSEREAQRQLERTNYSYKLFKTPLAGTLERMHLQGLLRYALAAILVSTAVQMSLLPFLVIYFHRLSFASFLLNIGVSLLMATVAITAAAALLVAQLSSTLAAPLISITNSLNWVMVHSVDPFARLGAASIRLPEYTGWAIAVYGLYYLPLTQLVCSLAAWRPLDQRGFSDKRRFRIRIIAVAQLFAVGLIIVHPLSAGRATGKLFIDFLDVGQGDSALITFPNNTTLLIDAGGRPGPFGKGNNRFGELDDGREETVEREARSIGESVVSEYLWWRGLDHVDYILATHADADHIDGLNDVARNFAVRAALVARTPRSDPEYARFAETLTSTNIPLQIIGAGDVLKFGEVKARVLWPMAVEDPNAPSRNNDSVVLRLQLGSRALLLTGDIEMSGEDGILRTSEDLRADVVKVAHHGSKTSSTDSFVAASRPRFAIISVGQTSIFGHPNAEVVERWKRSGAEVLTTGTSGTITVTTDGRQLALETFVKKK